MGGRLDFHFKNVYFATGASVLDKGTSDAYMSSFFAFCLLVCLLTRRFFHDWVLCVRLDNNKKEEKNSTNSHDKTHGEIIWT